MLFTAGEVERDKEGSDQQKCECQRVKELCSHEESWKYKKLLVHIGTYVDTRQNNWGG